MKGDKKNPFPKRAVIRVGFGTMVCNQEKRMGNLARDSAFCKRSSPFQGIPAGQPFDFANIDNIKLMCYFLLSRSAVLKQYN